MVRESTSRSLSTTHFLWLLLAVIFAGALLALNSLDGFRVIGLVMLAGYIAILGGIVGFHKGADAERERRRRE